ncbi:MAG: T9SS type A sorting domain-containing protein [Flavobacteriales bacterium]|nr:T9SS type A sorting domain-containing protein [Flavobacteriales bacterium]
MEVVPVLRLAFAPNPFIAEITIHLALPESGKVELRVFDILGQEVATIANQVYTKGQHKLTFLGTELPAGRYYFHLSTGGKVIIRQVVKKN